MSDEPANELELQEPDLIDDTLKDLDDPVAFKPNDVPAEESSSTA